MKAETVSGRQLEVGEGVLSPGDFLGVRSDGVPHAGRGHLMNLKWGWDEIASGLEASAQSRSLSAQRLLKGVIRETRLRYGEDVGDDATFVGFLARAPRRLMVFTGPPKENAGDAEAVQGLLACDGRRLPTDRNGASLLADELLRSDSVFFLAGESTNPHYQNPLLPKSVSIRQNLVTQLADVLVRLGKAVRTEWC